MIHFSASVQSTRGNNKTQGFVNGDSFYAYHFLMAKESEAANGILAYIHKVGIPAKIHTDNSKVQTLSTWPKTINKYHFKMSTT